MGSSDCSAFSAVTDLERLEILPLVGLHPAVDLVLGEAMGKHHLAGDDDFGAEPAAQLDLAPLSPALDALEEVGASGSNGSQSAAFPM